MRFKTKILVIEQDEETGKRLEYWDKFEFYPTKYISHLEHEHGSVLYLSGAQHPFVIQFSFEELSNQLDFLNTFEFINLN